MSFVQPGFLWALFALAIPVIIHLFQLRRFKRIDFPNVRLLQEVSQQTRARKKVQHWLVLLSRMAAITCLVLAFAQPVIKSTTAPKAGQRAVSIYVDDSFSMDGTNSGGRLLDQARGKAQDVQMAHDATDRFQVLTGAFSGREQVLMNRDDALDAAAQVGSGPYTRQLSQVMARQHEALSRSEAVVKRMVLLTDLQRSVTDVERWTNDSTTEVVLVPIQADAVDNLSIDSVYFDSPVRRLGNQEILHVRIRNHGTAELQNVPLKLTIDGIQRGVASFAISAGATIDTTLHFQNERAGTHWAEVSLMDRPVQFDDRMYLSWRTIERSVVTLLTDDGGESDKAIAAVLGADSLDRFTSVPYRNVDLGNLATSDLVILNGLNELPSGLVQELSVFLANGGSVAVFPAASADVASYGTAMVSWKAGGFAPSDTARVKVERIDLDDPFFRDVFETMPRNVDLPEVRKRFRLSPPPGTDILLRLQNGDPFLSHMPVDRGSLYLCAAPLAPEGGSFTRHALFVATLLRMSELSRPMGALYHTIGTETVLPLQGIELSGDKVVHLLGPQGIDIVPEIRRGRSGTGILLHDEDLPDGPYAIMDGTDTLDMLALNVSRKESDLSSYTPEELEEKLELHGLSNYRVLISDGNDLSVSLKELDQGRKLWKWFMLLALLFLAVETILIRSAR